MLSLKTLWAAMIILKNELTPSALPHIGISGDDFERLTAKRMWNIQDRIPVQRTLQAVRDGLATAQGFAPFRAPAEYQAAIIDGLVSPVNRRAACSWLADVSLHSAADEASGVNAGTAEPVTPSQLFGLCLECEANKAEFEAQHDSKMHKEVTRPGTPAMQQTSGNK